MKAVMGKEILLVVGDKKGRLEEISKAIMDAGVNIRAISAWAFDSKAYFRLVASDNEKAKKAIEGIGIVEENDVIIVEMPDKTGQLHALAAKLKENKINLNRIYGTTIEPDKSAIIIFSSEDNDKALEVIRN